MSSPLVCDTSGVLAALDRADPDHAACVAALEAHRGPLVLSPFVLAELDHLVRTRLGQEAARSLLDDVAAGAYEVGTIDTADVAACLDADRAYADHGLGLADCSVVVLAHRWGTRSVLTLDHRHFRAVHPLQGGAFSLLPAD